MTGGDSRSYEQDDTEVELPQSRLCYGLYPIQETRNG